MKKFLLKKQEKLPKHLSEIKKELKKKEGKPAKKKLADSRGKELTGANKTANKRIKSKQSFKNKGLFALLQPAP